LRSKQRLCEILSRADDADPGVWVARTRLVYICPMVVDSSASLAIYSDTHTAAEVTALLGVEPTGGGEIGDAKHPPRLDRERQPARQFFYKQSTWLFDVPDGADSDDESGFASVRRLLDIFGPKSEVLGELRRNYRTIIWWAGFSDSSQGGFVMPAELLSDLGELGCDLFGTVYTGDVDLVDELSNPFDEPTPTS